MNHKPTLIQTPLTKYNINALKLNLKRQMKVWVLNRLLSCFSLLTTSKLSLLFRWREEGKDGEGTKRTQWFQLYHNHTK